MGPGKMEKIIIKKTPGPFGPIAPGPFGPINLEAEGRLNGGLRAKPPGKWGPLGSHLGAHFLGPIFTIVKIVCGLPMQNPVACLCRIQWPAYAGSSGLHFHLLGKYHSILQHLRVKMIRSQTRMPVGSPYSGGITRLTPHAADPK